MVLFIRLCPSNCQRACVCSLGVLLALFLNLLIPHDIEENPEDLTEDDVIPDGDVSAAGVKDPDTKPAAAAPAEAQV